MKRIVEQLMARDGLSKSDAVEQVRSFFNDMQEDIASGGDPFTWENEFVDEFGLEPDFFEDLAFRLAF